MPKNRATLYVTIGYRNYAGIRAMKRARELIQEALEANPWNAELAEAREQLDIAASELYVTRPEPRQRGNAAGSQPGDTP